MRHGSPKFRPLARLLTGAVALALGLGCEASNGGEEATTTGCPTGLADCDGACANLTVDVNNCGACGVVCNASQQCGAAGCECRTGYSSCNDACVDTGADPNNCGGCGVACNGQVCSQGVCADSCSGGLTNCSGACVDLQTSSGNCGACGTVCGAGQSCAAGNCGCPVGQALCNGSCLDVQSDPLNCGACGNACAGGATCAAGVCAGGGSGGTGGGGGTTSGGGGAASGGGGATTGGATTGGVVTGGGGSTSGGGGAATGGGGAATGGGGATTGGVTTGGGGASVTADCDNTAPVLDNPAPASDFTEDVNGVSIDMVYIPGGTFTLGCESGTCPADTTPVPDVTVSSYHIAKNQVTAAMWEAVMGESPGGFGLSITWYDAMRFACELSRQTGRAYRMQTEAEFEYAAKNHLSSLADIGEDSMSGEEWAYNSWNLTHMGGTDPVGPNSGKHTQKTRRDIQGSADNITGRLIRSIDGIGPQLRLVISNETDFPPDYVPPCDLCAPVMGDEPVNSYRDPRWVTGSDSHWTTGSIAIGSFDLWVWDDGTARMNNTDGQWFTSNNIAFVFVPSSGSSTKYAYIFLDENQGSVISDAGFMSGGYIGRFERESASGTKPTISGLQSGAELAAAAGDDFDMVDMVNIPESAQEQDPRLLDGTDECWFQDNSDVGGLHHYRKDVDPDEFRFTVNQGQMTMLANGAWFTVNNTFLRITHSTGYTTDYLYAIDSNGYFYHNSYQAYERADFRMFQKKSNSEAFPASCGSHCSSEIPKGEPASFYATQEDGQSTFVPAPCPAGGC